MFKLYSEISALGRFSNGFCTEYIDQIDSVQWFEVKGGIGYISPEKPDYYYGHAVNLFDAPAQDITGENLIKLWDEYIKPRAPKALKRIVCWEAETFLTYPHIDKKFNPECEVMFKYSPSAKQISRPTYNIKKITIDDFQQMVDIYVADSGEAQRGFNEWRTHIRMDAIAAGHSNFFAIWNRDKNEIAAIAGLYWKNGIYRYASVATRKAYRGRGYASALIAHIRDYAINDGAKELYIVAENNSQAAGIYMNAGFEVDGYAYSILADC